MSLTLCRPQEFYECNSTKLRNKVFDFSDFLDHYLQKDGSIDYFNYWAGFNLPSHILEEFFKHFELSKKEKELYKLTRKFANKPYYVIATKKNDSATLKHELVHAYYYLNPSYKQKVDTVVRHMRTDLKKDLINILKTMGYSNNVIIDEINAYMASSTTKYLKEEFYLDLTKKDVKPFVELANNILRD